MVCHSRPLDTTYFWYVVDTTAVEPLVPRSPPIPLSTANGIRPIPLSPVLQRYFFNMQRTVTYTCHPFRICEEAAELANTLLYNRRTIADVSNYIFVAGIANIEYCRSVALLASQLNSTLNSRSRGLRVLLESELLDTAIMSFRNAWENVGYRHPSWKAQTY
jgi:hypothetical protein